MHEETINKIKDAIKTDNIEEVEALEKLINAMNQEEAKACFEVAFKNNCVTVLKHFLDKYTWLYRFVTNGGKDSTFFSEMFRDCKAGDSRLVIMEGITKVVPDMKVQRDVIVLEDMPDMIGLLDYPGCCFSNAHDNGSMMSSGDLIKSLNEGVQYDKVTVH